MFKLTAPKLAEKSVAFRYVYYMISAFRLRSFRSWRQAGEPNPFVGKTYRTTQTERVEFVDIFEDVLGPTAPKSRSHS